MIISDGASRSIWQTSATPSRITDPLREDVETDVCIVGAGIAGLTVAWQLIKAGKQVVVIDSAAAGAGQTGRSTAHVATALDNRYAAMERLHGTANMRLVAESLMAAVRELETIVREADLDCGFSKLDGYLIQAEGQEDPDVPGAELEAALRAGVAGVEVVDALPGAVGRPHGGLALRFPDQASFDPFKYNVGLLERVMEKGGRVFSRTGLEDLEELEGEQGWEVRTSSGHRIRAKSVVVATNAPVHHRFTMHTKQAAYRSYVVTFDLPAGAYQRILLWDTADPYHYVRMAPGTVPGRDVLIVGGEDHRTGQANDAVERYAALERWTRTNFPKAGRVVQKWSGQILEPADGLGFIGRDPTAEEVYLVTGDSGQGTSHAMIAGRLITDLILGTRNPWEEVYSPARKMTGLQGIKEFVSDQANVAAQYADFVKGSEIEDEEQLQRGDGAVIRRGVGREAIHRDENGILHRHSAICPHLGCVVQWNREEQTWDCPCHGSRFQTDGKAVEGPAVSGLEER